MQPPQSNPDPFGNPNEQLRRETPSPGSIPPPGGYPPPGNYAVPQRGPEVSFDTITDAWNLFTGQLGPWVGAGVLYFVLILAPLLVVQVAINLSTAAVNPQDPFANFPWALLGAVYIWIIFCSLFLHLGFTKMATTHVRTGRTSIGELFSAFGVLPAYLGAAFIVGLGATVAACFCLVPGLIVAGLTLLTFPLIVDQRMGAMQAINTSWSAMRPHMWMATLYFVVIYIILAAGGACYIGVLATMPLYYLSIACVYRDFFLKQPPAPGDQQQYQAPIADPGI